MDFLPQEPNEELLEQIRQSLRNLFENKDFTQELKDAITKAMNYEPAVWQDPVSHHTYIFTTKRLDVDQYEKGISLSGRPMFRFYEYWLYADNVGSLNGMDYEIVPLEDRDSLA